MTTIRTLLDQLAQTRCAATCLISPDEKHELGYAQLQQRAAAMARRLAGRGFGKGAKIALLLDKRLEVLFGAMYGGLVPVPLNANAAKSEWRTFCIIRSRKRSLSPPNIMRQ